MIYDLIVVGSGSVGAAAGYYATKAGLKVLMIDSANPPHDQGSHHGDTRLIRHAYGEGECYVPMVLRAQELWYELEKHSGAKIMHRCGVLNIGPKDEEFIKSLIESAHRYKLPIQILTAAEVMKRWPQVSVPNDNIGVFEENSGYLKCEVAIRSWICLAKAAGSVQLFNCSVFDIGRVGDKQRVKTAKGAYLGRKVLVSAGTWVNKLLPQLPITPTRQLFSWYQSDDRYEESNDFPGFIVVKRDGSNYYGFPANNNVFKIGKHSGGLPIKRPADRLPFGEVAGDSSEVLDVLREFFPGVGKCLEGKSCTYDNTPDKCFIIDTLPGEPNRLIISGLSGHGFKFSSVLGEIAATFAQNKPMPFDLKPFSLSRFNNHKL